MASGAVVGFGGVILGSLTTSVLTIYKERLTTRREQAARDEQYDQDRKAARDTFQQDSILALQAAISDLIRAVYQELDRVLAQFNQTGDWPARQWETRRQPAGPMPCCGWSCHERGYSMISCAPLPPSCAPWRATAFGPAITPLPSSSAGASNRCRLIVRARHGWPSRRPGGRPYRRLLPARRYSQAVTTRNRMFA